MRCSLHRGSLLITSLVSLANPAAQADQPPDPEFLLYLEQMRRVDGEWVDPVQMENLKLPDEPSAEGNSTDAHKNPEEEGSHEH